MTVKIQVWSGYGTPAMAGCPGALHDKLFDKPNNL